MSFPADYRAPTDLLQDRVILVTGAGDGIGRAVAKACASHGATVVLLGKTVAKLESVYDEIEAEGGPQPAIYPMNLEGATPADHDQLALTLEGQLSRLDGLVHCAALLPYLSRLKDYEVEDWLKVLQVNLNAPFMLTQALLPLLQRSPEASVVFTGDRVGLEAKPFWGAYGVSKAGVDALARMWAAELESTTVRVNLVDPGPTRTALRKRVYPGEDNSSLKLPESLAPLYLWLLGSDSQPVTGESFAWPTC
ncbi:MAG: YciK family oxidoreductase [Gammaproteobacteria bacterium]|nr:MAG: YciK family oxidoreductase [Gammaproteobacteria bacterium]